MIETEKLQNLKGKLQSDICDLIHDFEQNNFPFQVTSIEVTRSSRETYTRVVEIIGINATIEIK